ncbi:MAG: ferrous iron transport protein A [Candidatus Hermodarchaeota archaeon]
MILLAHLNEGDEAEISYARGGRGIILRINELGFYPGSRIKMIRNIRAGPVLVELKGCRIAVGRGIAMKIFCKKIENTVKNQKSSSHRINLPFTK